MPVTINFWAVLVAAIASFVVGSIWYSPAMFAKKWMRSLNLSPVPDQNMVKTMGGMFISLLVQAYILAHFAVYAGAMTVAGGIMLGVWVWLGFIAMFTLTTVLFERKNSTWYWITNGYQLLSLVVMGVILALWR